MEFNLADLFESVVDTVPEREALICGERRLTFAALDERANRLAHFLAAQGVGAGDHVGLQLYNGTEYVEGMLAAFKLRAVPININFRYVEAELRYLFDNADLVALIHHREFAPRVAAVAPHVPSLRTTVIVDDASGASVSLNGSTEYEEALRAGSPERDFAPRSAGDLFIIYTGGTTGMPKGVMWRHEDIFFAGLFGGDPGGVPVERPEELAERVASKPAMAMMAVAPLIHGAAQLATLIAFFQGAKMVLVPRFDPARIWAAVEAERVSTMSLVGDAMARPLAEALAAPGAHYDASSLLVVSSAGAIFSDPVKAQLREQLPAVMFIDAFGASETGSQGMDAGVTPVAGALRFRMHDRTAVLDDSLRPVALGSDVIGRVALRGYIPLGYYKDPEKTAATFVEVDGVRWVIPGDLARVAEDGTVIVLGRGSVCINSGGEKIFPEEVEAALKSHPGVFDAVVVGVPDARWGERVAAIIQPRPGHAPTLADVDAHCRRHIAGYKIPRQLHIVEHIVRSPSGKADYPWAKALAKG